MIDVSGIKDPAQAATMIALPATLRAVTDGATEMVQHYLACVYFTDTGEDEQPPVDALLSDSAQWEALRDCTAFLQACEAQNLLAPYLAAVPNPWEQMGHDFWLTRNRHGAGFWDRGLGDLGDKLSEIARHAGQIDVYQGDDGLIYF